MAFTLLKSRNLDDSGPCRLKCVQSLAPFRALLRYTQNPGTPALTSLIVAQKFAGGRKSEVRVDYHWPGYVMSGALGGKRKMTR